MIKQQRKRHLQVWTVLLFSFPAMIISGWLAIKKPAITDALLQPATAIGLPVIVKSVVKENYTANLRTDNQRTALQLEWINKQPITAASALIYNGSVDNNNIIGRIDARGTYHFPLKNDLTGNNHFILYDIIHRQVVDSINF